MRVAGDLEASQKKFSKNHHKVVLRLPGARRRDEKSGKEIDCEKSAFGLTLERANRNPMNTLRDKLVTDTDSAVRENLRPEAAALGKGLLKTNFVRHPSWNLARGTVLESAHSHITDGEFLPNQGKEVSVIH